MHPQIGKVLYYIETHLDDPLDLSVLAKVAGYSPYHFCRIFKSQVGEPALAYATRLKLQRASLNVLCLRGSIIEIALDAGYETPNGFYKSFRKIFGMTPTAYRQQRTRMLASFKECLMQTPEIVERPETHVVFQRETGPYETGSVRAWQTLSRRLNDLAAGSADPKETSNIVLHPADAELLGICHDDPTVTSAKNIRYDAAIAWEKPQIDFLKRQGFDTRKIDAGRYLKSLHKGPHEGLLDHWLGLYAWAQEHGCEFRDAPPFEKYLNLPDQVAPEALRSELYLPIV